MELDLDTLKGGLVAFREAVTSLKALKDLLPDSPDKDKIEQEIAVVERAAALADAEIAKALGYSLCKCTYPPQIMLSIGHQNGRERFQCNTCGEIIPPEWNKPKVITKKFRFGGG